MTDAADSKSIVNSVLRACKILEMFAAEGSELSLSRIAEASSLCVRPPTGC